MVAAMGLAGSGLSFPSSLSSSSLQMLDFERQWQSSSTEAWCTLPSPSTTSQTSGTLSTQTTTWPETTCTSTSELQIPGCNGQVYQVNSGATARGTQTIAITSDSSDSSVIYSVGLLMAFEGYFSGGSLGSEVVSAGCETTFTITGSATSPELPSMGDPSGLCSNGLSVTCRVDGVAYSCEQVSTMIASLVQSGASCQ